MSLVTRIEASANWGPAKVKTMGTNLDRPSGGSYASQFCSALDEIIDGGNMLLANGVQMCSEKGVWKPGMAGA